MICPYCQNQAKWCENKEKYGRNYGKSYMCYYCKPCDAYVGCHNNTKEPLGTMADKELRQWRMEAHKAFDPIWQEKGLRRKEAYRWLNQKLGYEVHIGQSDIEQCKKIIEVCKTF